MTTMKPSSVTTQAHFTLSLTVIVCTMLMCLVSGCTSTGTTKTDDAKKRAIAENVTNAEAAKYYTYRAYKDESGKEYRHVPDFFAGMDALSVPVLDSSGEAENPDGSDSAPGDMLGSQPDPLLDTLADAASNVRLRPETRVQVPELTESERIGRNTWMAWCAGNEGFWDWLCTDSLGFIDLLKLVDSRKRNQRFADAGLINEPGMEQAKSARIEEYGLWLDVPADRRVRIWRSAYVAETFQAIGEGKHKSQIGLLRKGVSGDYDGSPLYVGAPDAFKDELYRYPSDYLLERETRYGASGASADAIGMPYAADGQSQPNERPYADLDEVVPPPDLYGLSSGVIGLRLFPNPYFDKHAAARWDADRFYEDPSYYNDPKLVRPYRVGMSCAFCHASFHPLNPPHDVNNPRWTNLSGNIGAQYLSMRATVGGQLTPDQFVYHLLDSQPRGTIDTSLIASDNINNPNTMNAVFGLPQRAILSLHNPQERLSKESSRLPSLWKNPDPKNPGDGVDVVPDQWVQVAKDLGVADQVAHSNDNPRHVPRILLDGSDSIGTWGALARVYLNIGSYWEQWNELHQVVLGFTPQRPFRLADCEEYSVYWNATEQRVPGLRDYFLRVTPTMPLLSTEGGQRRIQPITDAELNQWKRQSKSDEGELAARLAEERAKRVDVSKLERGRLVFADNCIVCHSSIQPESTESMFPDYDSTPAFDELVEKRIRVRNASEHDGEFWEHDPYQWLNDNAYQRWAREIVDEPKFWTENYLSTDYRIPVTLVNTNAARAMATNGMTGHMWEDFASQSYRELPSPGLIEYFNPYKGEQGDMDSFAPRHINPNSNEPDGGGGPGYYRVPTLMSIWATAPLLHNNSLGLYNNDPSVDGRLEAFDDAIRKLLWPEKRFESSSYNAADAERLKRDHGLIWRTTEETYLSVDAERVPGFVHRNLGFVAKLHQYRGFGWVHYVRPLWLPSAIMLIGALIILLVSNHEFKRAIAFALIFIAAALAVVLWWARTYPDIQWVDWIRDIQPWFVPVVILVIVAVLLLLPLSRGWTRCSGYALVVLGLLMGTVIYFNAGRLGDLNIGPIPAGTPVNLLANFNSEADFETQKQSVTTLIAGLAEIESRHLDAEATQQVMRKKIAPALMAVNKCPDFVMDKGHYFPWFDSMTDDDKNALIELLKTL